MKRARRRAASRRGPVARVAALTAALIAVALALGMAAAPSQALAQTLAVDDVTIDPEGNTGTRTATFTITLSAPSLTDVGEARTADGTAVAPADYVSVPVTQATIPAGETVKTVDVTVNGDVLDEVDETFQGGAQRAGRRDHRRRVRDRDDRRRRPAAGLTINDPTVVEGTGTSRSLVFTVTLTPASGRVVTVDYATADGSAVAGSDYTARTGTLSFSPAVTTLTVSVSLTTDSLDEVDESLSLNLTLPAGSSATIADAQGAGTITDDDGPTISVNDVTVAEGDAGTTAATFSVTLSAASVQPVTVRATTTNDTALAPGDFTALAADAAVTIPIGSTTGTLTVVVVGDRTDEADERFRVTLSAPQGGALSDNIGLGTITDDDAPPLMRIEDVQIREGSVGATTVTLKVALSRASERAVTFTYATSDGTATGSVDYAEATEALSISAAQTERAIALPIGADRIVENDETFTVRLSSVVNATLDRDAATVTIVDDDLTADNAPVLSVDDVEVAAEGDAGSKPVTFTVRLATPPARTVGVSYATADSGAKAPADYAAVAGRLTFAAGETSKAVTTTVAGDILFEGLQRFFLRLAEPTNATIGDGSATATIRDDDVGLASVTVPASIDASKLFCLSRRPCPGLRVTSTLQTRGELVYELAAVAPRGKRSTKLIPIMKTSALANAARRYLATLRPTPGARARNTLRRLRTARAATLRVKVTFTNRGGDETTTTKRVRLNLKR